MKKLVSLFLVVVLSGCAGLGTSQQAEMAVGELLDQVQIAIDEIGKNSASSSLPPLKTAEIIVSTEYTRSGGAGAKIFVGAKGEKSSTENNSLTLTLTPNTTKAKSSERQVGHDIAEYVIAAVRAVDEQKALQLSKLSVEVGLEIVESSEGGLEIEVSGVSIEGKKAKSSTSGHKLSLLFEAK